MADIESLKRELEVIKAELKGLAPNSRAYRKLDEERAQVEAQLIDPGAIAQETGNSGRIWSGSSTRALLLRWRVSRFRWPATAAKGIFHITLQVEDCVRQWQVIAEIKGQQLTAPLDGVPVTVKTKVVEVDPLGAQAQISGIARYSFSYTYSLNGLLPNSWFDFAKALRRDGSLVKFCDSIQPIQ